MVFVRVMVFADVMMQVVLIYNGQLEMNAKLMVKYGMKKIFHVNVVAPMVGINIGVPAPMAYFPFGGAKDSFFGDLKAHGRDGFEFFTDKRLTIYRWP